MNNIEIRDLKIEDLKEFFKLFEQLLKEDFPEYGPKATRYFLEVDFSESYFLSAIKEKNKKILIATSSNRIVGFLIANNTFGGIGFVSWLGIGAEYRGQKIGQNLLIRYEEFCKEQLAHKVELWTTDKNIGFYEKCGYKMLYRRSSSYFGSDDCFMEKVIGKWDEKYLDKYF